MQEIISEKSQKEMRCQNREKPISLIIDSLKNERLTLINQKYEYEKKVKGIETLIKEKQLQIAEVCKNSEEGHQWITERESGPYGEKYTYCKRCRIDYYGNYCH